MGTLTEKMLYILDTKSFVKSAIEDKGVDVGSSTFRNFYGKIEQIGGSPAKAKYEIVEATGSKTVPEVPYTAGDYLFEADSNGYKNSNEECQFYTALNDAYGVYQLFDDDLDTGTGNASQEYPLYFKSNTKVMSIKAYTKTEYPSLYYFHVYGTNNEADQVNMSNMTLVGKYPFGDDTGDMWREAVLTSHYKYYAVFFADNAGTTVVPVYEVKLDIATNALYAPLSSANMTPECYAYYNDYMRFVTRLFKTGNDVINPVTVIMKPYDDGGNLINYTDDGSAVSLKMYLLHPDGTTSEVVSDFVQPELTANGTIGGAAFAVAADSEVDANRPAWKAFDGSEVLSNTSTDQWHSGNGQPHWIKFYNPDLLRVSKITIFNGADNVLPLAWEFQCSDDNSTWTTLTSGTNTNLTQGSNWDFTVSDSGWHKYYRFYTTTGYGADSGYLGLTEVEITGEVKKTVVHDSYNYVLSPNGMFELPDGYDSKALVATLDIPAHYYNNNGTWELGGNDE